MAGPPKTLDITTAAADTAADSGHLDGADGELLRFGERTGSDVAVERLQAARNRSRIFRESLSGGGDDLLVVHADRTGTDDGTTVVDNADALVGTVTVGFYDGDGTELGTATSGERRSTRTRNPRHRPDRDSRGDGALRERGEAQRRGRGVPPVGIAGEYS